MLPQRKLNFLLNSSDSCTNLQLPIKALISLFLLFSSKIRIIVPLYSAPDPSISPASLQSPLSSITQIGREIRVYRSFVAWFRNLAPPLPRLDYASYRKVYRFSTENACRCTSSRLWRTDFETTCPSTKHAYKLRGTRVQPRQLVTTSVLRDANRYCPAEFTVSPVGRIIDSCNDLVTPQPAR